MNLSELINLEVQFLRDEQARTEEELAAIDRRDRAIGHHVAEATGLSEATATQSLAESRSQRHAACRHWLAQLPKQTRDELPGDRIEVGYRTAGWLLFLVFFLLGIGTASAALASHERSPVNILVFVVVFFLLQILLLVLYPVLLLIRRVRGGELLPWLQGLVVRISQLRIIGKLTGRTEGEADLTETLGQLRLRQTIYGGVQQWLLFSLVQRMAIGFNLAALLTSLYTVTFHDVAFCWSTTLSIDASQLGELVSYIAAPWSWLGEFAAPELQAIEVSRYVPTDGGYLALTDGMTTERAIELRRTWWHFLVAGLITWGLLPRALAYAVGVIQTSRSSHRLPLNHMAVQHLFERLFPPTADWSGPAPADVRGARPRAMSEVPPRKLVRDAKGPCHLVCWGTLFDDRAPVKKHVTDRFGQAVGGVHGAGLADLDADQRALRAIAKASVTRVVVTLPEGQQPTKDLMRFLQELRQQNGPRMELVVGLLAKSATGFEDVGRTELQIWRERLLAEADPYLSLQNMAPRGAGEAR